MRATDESSFVRVKANDRRLCKLQVECAKRSMTLRCLDLSMPGKTCDRSNCQMTCLICGLAIVSRDEPDFKALQRLEKSAMARNQAVVTTAWPRHPVHLRCCRAVLRTPTKIAKPPPTIMAGNEIDRTLHAMGIRTPPRAASPKKAEDAKPTDWSSLMDKMRPAPLKKPKPAAKKPAVKPANTAKPSSVPARFVEPPSHRGGAGEFDISQHGYWLRRGELVYRTTDGQTLAAVGVDKWER